MSRLFKLTRSGFYHISLGISEIARNERHRVLIDPKALSDFSDVSYRISVEEALSRDNINVYGDEERATRAFVADQEAVAHGG